MFPDVGVDFPTRRRARRGAGAYVYFRTVARSDRSAFGKAPAIRRSSGTMEFRRAELKSLKR
jgi:hypothetical protein